MNAPAIAPAPTPTPTPTPATRGALVTIHEADLRSPRQSGARLRAYCPVHGGDRQRSLSIAVYGDLAGYGFCHACGAKVFVPEMNTDAAARFSEPGRTRAKRPISADTLLRPVRSDSRGDPSAPAAAVPSWQQRECAALLALGERMRARLTDPRAVDYLSGRGIPGELAAALGVGYIPAGARIGGQLAKWRDRLTFPLASPAGAGYAGRSLYGWAPGMDENAHKTLLDAGSSGSADNADKATPRRWEKTYPAGWFGYGCMAGARLVVLVEGPIDALALIAAGLSDVPVVALVGTAGRADWIPAQVRGVVLALDGDGPGRQAGHDLARELYMAGLDVVTCAPPAEDGRGKDWAERWRLAGIDGVWPVFDALEAFTLPTVPTVPTVPAVPAVPNVPSAPPRTAAPVLPSETAETAIPAVEIAPDVPSVAGVASALDDETEATEATPAVSGAAIRHHLMDYGETHDWPRLAIGYSVSDHTGTARPFKWILPSADGWRRFVLGASLADITAARAAIEPALSAAGMEHPMRETDKTDEPTPPAADAAGSMMRLEVDGRGYARAVPSGVPYAEPVTPGEPATADAPAPAMPDAPASPSARSAQVWRIWRQTDPEPGTAPAFASLDEAARALWFGDELAGELEACGKAYDALARWVAGTFDGCHLMQTPARTGLVCIEHALPWGKGQPRPFTYPQLAPELGRLIAANTPAHRMEVTALPDTMIERLAIYDARVAWLSYLRHLPVLVDDTPLIHDAGPYERFRNGLYRARVSVPGGWAHLGLAPRKRSLGDGWEWPATPGDEWEAWLDECEMRLLADNAWPVEVQERILFAGPKAPGNDPLREFHECVSRQIERADAQIPRTPALNAYRHGLRALALHAIGAWFKRDNTRSYDVADMGELETLGILDELDPARSIILPEDDGGAHVEGAARLSAYQEHWRRPEWFAAVLARERVTVTRRALTLPCWHVLALDGDGLYLADLAGDALPDWTDTGRVGCYRAKLPMTPLARPQRVPSTLGELRRLAAGLQTAKTSKTGKTRKTSKTSKKSR